MRNFLYAVLGISMIVLFVESDSRFFSIINVYINADIDSVTYGEITDVRKAYVPSAGPGGWYRYHVSYMYDVEGTHYLGWLVSFRGLPTLEEVDGRYYLGKKVRVHYDSKNPRYAMLEPGSFGGRIYLQIAAGISLVLLAVAASFFRVRRA